MEPQGSRPHDAHDSTHAPCTLMQMLMQWCAECLSHDLLPIQIFSPMNEEQSLCSCGRTSSADLTPQCLRRVDMRTPVQWEQAVAAGPQLKPLLFFTMFCSFRRLPAHTYEMAGIGVWGQQPVPLGSQQVEIYDRAGSNEEGFKFKRDCSGPV